ncbi:MAG: hypothetical protein ACKO1W_00300, partial [Microcystaceae cyanobacterium]
HPGGVMDTIQLVADKMQQLSGDRQSQVLDFVEFLITQSTPVKPRKSAEALALERIKDIDDPSKWITVVEADEPIDEQAIEEWLVQRGYKKALSSPTA